MAEQSDIAIALERLQLAINQRTAGPRLRAGCEMAAKRFRTDAVRSRATAAQFLRAAELEDRMADEMEALVALADGKVD